ncbi:unnamed protein product [Allacma fusca]|uniref:Uncharacterized protein n=1 Tax=Allacma fusca TaxID=39272 RepID=A0A8J2NS40_9HEXA|nr:unnamed protein product [Allacma fusca]
MCFACWWPKVTIIIRSQGKKGTGFHPQLCCACWWPNVTITIRSQGKKGTGFHPQLCCACCWPTITVIIRSQKRAKAIVQNCVVLAGGQTLPLSKFLFVANLEKLNQKIFFG